MAVAAPATYPEGQCTWYVANWYPKLWSLPTMGNACQWWDSAGQRGWQRRTQPWVGSVVVYRCDFPGSGGYGHVAVVTGVNNDGSFNVSESNFSHALAPDTRGNVQRTQWIIGFIQVPGAPAPGAGAGATPATNAANATGTLTADQTNNNNQNSPCPAPGPATGARGLKCNYNVQLGPWPLYIPIPNNVPLIGGHELGPVCLGGWSVCLDGLVGINAMFAGAVIIVVGVILAVKNPVEVMYGRYIQVLGAGTEVVGTVAMQPEVVAAGEAGRRVGKGISKHGGENEAKAQAARYYRRYQANQRAAARQQQQMAQRGADYRLSRQKMS
ncbi:MAG: CHAP domain-containing protein, partial [Streptomyces sp.]|nr:CHAP domain-containing protein [Streptomyces sp.]